MIFSLSCCLSIYNILCMKVKHKSVSIAHWGPSSISISHAPLPSVQDCKKKKKKNPYTPLQTHTHPALTHFCAYFYTKTHTILTNWLAHTDRRARMHAHTHAHNYISTLGVWQRRGKNQSGSPGTWMNRLWSKPHQSHIDDLPQSSIFLPSVGSGPLFVWGAFLTWVTSAHHY